MQKVEMTYTAHGTSALKAYPRAEEQHSARIIAFPARSITRNAGEYDAGRRASAANQIHQDNKASFEKPTRLQSSIAMVLGIVFAYAVFFI